LKKQLIYIILLTNSLLFAQSESNLEKINTLLNETCKEIKSNLISPFTINFQAPGNLYFLKNRTEINFIELEKDNNTAKDTLSFTIEEAGITYKNIIKDGFFGNYLVERTAYMKGTYLLKQNGKIITANQFNKTITDSINYEDINKLENISLPFTRGTLPSEPIAPTIIEPLIAISSAVLTVVLFFTVRSK